MRDFQGFLAFPEVRDVVRTPYTEGSLIFLKARIYLKISLTDIAKSGKMGSAEQISFFIKTVIFLP
jgi:hypothetical protein